MQKIRIKFTDFWYGFDPANNYFYKLLSQQYKVEISDRPDLLIYSCYGTEYIKYTCTRVFFTAENIRPDFTGCDFAFSFDFSKQDNHYRLPLYALYTDNEKLLQYKTRELSSLNWRAKKKFCCMVVSNAASSKRIDFFKRLSAYKQVDSGGTVLNNIGGPVKDKLDFIKDYRFVIAFENSCYEGYTTEKIVEPLLTDCIPLYWGNPVIERDFNPARFLHLSAGKSDEDFIQEIIAADTNEEKALEILTAPVFNNNKIPGYIDKKNVLDFFETIVNFSKHQKPVALSFKGQMHQYNVKRKYLLSLPNRAVRKLLSFLTQQQPII